MARTEREDEIAEIGAEVLDECRAELMMAFRFMDTALWRMPFAPEPAFSGIGTDGSKLYFNPLEIASRFARDPNETVRDALHLVLHCVFRHPFDETPRDPEAWDLACDAVVEGVALEMAAERWPSDDDAARRAVVGEVEKLAGSLNPFRIYRVLEAVLADRVPDGLDAQACRAARASVPRWRTTLRRDNHAPWFRPDSGEDGDSARKSGGPDGDADAKSDDGEGDARPKGPEERDFEPDGQEPREEAGGEDAGEAAEAEDAREGDPDEGDDAREQADRAWREIAKEVEAGMARMSQREGTAAGALGLNVELAVREPVDYADFLRRFAVRTEEIKVNPDEFDYVFYTYGLRLYGNMPLVEPLEYQETERVREFVIAIDTSGSCSDELVRTFVTRTCEILRETDGFAREVNVHIVQCDARVQRVDRISSIDDLERYAESFQVFGRGGTDFRPVFAYVDELVAAGEFKDLRGLIYFTDGQGTYPQTMPAYDTAFVFVDDDPVLRRVPPWAMKVVIDSDSIRNL